MNKYMEMAIEEVNINKKNNFLSGGPFGAVIVKDGKVISKAHNTVLESNDPSAHAEINAIRKAGEVLNTHDLTGCIIYTTSYPCPMCLSAIIWSNIKTIYYGNTKEDASDIGFSNDDNYDIINNPDKYLKLINIDRDKTIESFNEFKKDPHLY